MSQYVVVPNTGKAQFIIFELDQFSEKIQHRRSPIVAYRVNAQGFECIPIGFESMSPGAIIAIELEDGRVYVPRVGVYQTPDDAWTAICAVSERRPESLQ